MVRCVLVCGARHPHDIFGSMDTAMGSHTRLVDILSLVQGSSFPIFLNFDPKFKGSENIRFTHTHGRVDSHGSMVDRTSVASWRTHSSWCMGPRGMGLIELL